MRTRRITYERVCTLLQDPDCDYDVNTVLELACMSRGLDLESILHLYNLILQIDDNAKKSGKMLQRGFIGRGRTGNGKVAKLSTRVYTIWDFPDSFTQSVIKRSGRRSGD